MDVPGGRSAEVGFGEITSGKRPSRLEGPFIWAYRRQTADPATLESDREQLTRFSQCGITIDG
jgi:hypothetical protein